MKRAHRTAHLALWVVLGPLALALLWISIAQRPPAPADSATAATHPVSAETHTGSTSTEPRSAETRAGKKNATTPNAAPAAGASDQPATSSEDGR